MAGKPSLFACCVVLFSDTEGESGRGLVSGETPANRALCYEGESATPSSAQSSHLFCYICVM